MKTGRQCSRPETPLPQVWGDAPRKFLEARQEEGARDGQPEENSAKEAAASQAYGP